MKLPLVELSCLMLTVFLQYVTVGANQCTQVLSRNEMRNILKQVPCIEKYQARCAWLSLNYCTFYHTTLCEKNVTETVKTYFIKTDCCQGYFRAKNSSCIKMRPGINYEKLRPTSTTPREDPGYVMASKDRKTPVDSVEPVISGGGYAGIICGMVLVVSIICFIVIAIRKRKRKKNAHSEPAQQVLYVPPPNTPIVKSSSKQQQLTSFQRQSTPSSSSRITPPGSPLNITVVSPARSPPKTPMITPPTSPLKTPMTTPPVSPIKLPNVDKPSPERSVFGISEDHSMDEETIPITFEAKPHGLEDTSLNTEDTPLNTEDTPLDTEDTPLLDPGVGSCSIEANSVKTSDISLEFDIDNLEDDNLPESDI